jgi:hypothetical protein
MTTDEITPQVRRRKLASILMICLAVSAGCEWFAVTGCDASAKPGIHIRIVDAHTNLPAAAGATVTITDGDYVEVEVVSADPAENDRVIGAAYERPGTYQITVAKAGYLMATLSGVVVTDGDCHVRTRFVTVAIAPE